MLPFTVHEAGDTGLVLDFGDKIDACINQHVLKIADQLGDLALAGIHETVPSFRSLLIQYDPAIVSATALVASIRQLAARDEIVPAAKRLWRLPVCYDKTLAQDISALAEQVGLSESSVVEAHSSRTYSIYMLGFLPGQPYLGDLAPELRVARRKNPRLKVPGGSVGVATSLTSIFPMETPSGWHLIGRTPVALWHQPVDLGPLLAPGDQVVFEPIDLDSFVSLAARAAAGSLQITPTTIAGTS